MTNHGAVHIVRSFGPNDATARLHSQPILGGLTKVSSHSVRLTPPTTDGTSAISDGAWIVFHYNDFPAIDAIRSLRRNRSALLTACLCSDVYSFKHYTSLEDIVDVFIAPTEAHRRILAYQLVKPVFVVPEAIDTVIPLATELRTTPEGRAVIWFGYAESFAKSMSSVVPVLRKAMEHGHIQSIRIITDLDALAKVKLELTGFSLHAYSGTHFFEDVRTSTYAILSHMPLDLELNSFIKSPNKLITSLTCGLVPLCSDTPNYAELLCRFGLDDYLYSSPGNLATMLARLDPVRDKARVADSGIHEFIREQFSHESVAARFVQVMDAVVNDLDRKGVEPAPAFSITRVSTLREHLVDLVPSARRMVSTRMKLWRAQRPSGPA